MFFLSLYKKKVSEEVPHRKIRIKDIAEQAGVSTGTVDRVLHKRGEVSLETRKKVLRIAEKLEYKPNFVARTLASKKEFHFGVLIPDASNSNPYWEAPLKGILKAQNELQSYGVRLSIKTFSLTNIGDFAQKSSKLLELKPDGLLLAPLFYSASTKFLDKCSVLSLPVVFIDAQLKYSNHLSYIGQNSCQAGFVAGRLLGMGQADNSRFAVFNIASERDQLHHFNERDKGFREFFKEKVSNNEIISYDIHGATSARLNEILLDYQRSSAGLDGIFVTSAKSHQVAKELEKLGMNSVRLVGFDLVKQNVKYLDLEIIDFLISQQPEEQGYLGIQTLYTALALKQRVSTLKSTPVDIITKENIKQYLACK
jgi:LacI family transcriptional regulator